MRVTSQGLCPSFMYSLLAVISNDSLNCPAPFVVLFVIVVRNRTFINDSKVNMSLKGTSGLVSASNRVKMSRERG